MRFAKWMMLACGAGAMAAPAAASASVVFNNAFVGSYASVGYGPVYKSDGPGKTYDSVNHLLAGVTKDAHSTITRSNGSAAAESDVSATFASNGSGSYSIDETVSTATDKKGAQASADTLGNLQYQFQLTGPQLYDLTLTGTVTGGSLGDGSFGGFMTQLDDYTSMTSLLSRVTTVGDSFNITLYGLQNGVYELQTYNWWDTMSGSSGLNGSGSASAFGNFSFNLSPEGVPEPGTWAFMILGLGGVGAMARRQRRMEAGPSLA